MGIDNTNKNSSQDNVKTTIKLNRKLRFWNKYKTMIIGAVSILCVVCIGFAVVKMVNKDAGKQTQADVATQNQSQTVQPTQATQEVTQQTTQATQTASQSETQQAQNTVKTDNGVYKLSGDAQSEDFNSKDFFGDAVFLGDSVMDGVSYYGYVPGTQVVSNGNMTTDKAKDYVSSVASANPGKVFIMVGLNDINYGTRDAEDITGYYSDLVSSIKSSVPNTKVYILSVLPVTKAFETKQNNKITQSAVDALNKALSEKAVSMGASYIDVSSAFIDGTGYMGSSFTGNGCNIYNEYYPFMLNGIAGVLK